MTLTDPTGGAGYAYGAKLPSTHMTSVTSQLPYAIDGNAGGVYNPSADIQIGTNTIKLLGANQLEYASRSVVRRHSFVTSRNDFNTGAPDWTINTNDTILQTTAGAYIYLWLLDLPHDNELDEVEVGWKAAGGHAASPPTCAMPTLYVYSSAGTGANTLLGSQADNPAQSKASYEAEHAITVSGIAHTIDRELYTYTAVLCGEDVGAPPDYLANGNITYLLTRCNVTIQPEH